ncbi:MAG: tssE [Rhizobacter sp.]|nr:tssE [Rhizobacter sp.]
MAGLTSQERLQPSLLDRLTDDNRLSQTEAMEARVLSRQQLRAAVLRDIGWLFNTTRAQPASEELFPDEHAMWERAGFARHSVLNFGVPALAGEVLGSLDFPAIEAQIRQALIDYEPRIDAASLAVEVEVDGSADYHHNALQLVIRGKLWNQPIPLEILLSAHIDVETGSVAVRDSRA